MGCVRATTKTLVGLVGLAYVIMFVTLTTVACLVFINFGHLHSDVFDNQLTIMPAVVILCAGLAFGLGALVAFCAAANHNKFLLTIFVAITAVCSLVLIALLAVSIAAPNALDAAKLKAHLETRLDKEYSISPNRSEQQRIFTEQIDFLQAFGHCCGINNYTDYRNTMLGYDELPVSCCAPDGQDYDACRNSTDGVFKQTAWASQNGCIKSIEDAIHEYAKILTIALSVVVAVLMVGLISGCVLCGMRRRAYDEPTYSTLVS